MKKILPFIASTRTDETQSPSCVDNPWLLTRREFVLSAVAGAAAVAAAPLFTFAADSTSKPAGMSIAELSKATAKLLDSTANNVVPGTKTKVFDAPVFGVSSAQDPLFLKLREVEGKNHYLPTDLQAGAKSVISWFLPYSDAVNKDNRVKEEKPDLWTKAHRQGARAEEFVRRFVEKSLTDANIGVFNPFHDQRYKNGTCVSNWSERHVAYISGLGTFGLSKNLITEKGAAGRMCSFIVDHEFTPTKRTYEGVYDNCIKCLACVARCPVGAIKKDGKIIGICARHVLTGKGGPDAIICGKCLTGVPCENCNPNPKAKAATTHPAPVA